jgi:hypothetical protein
MSGKSTLFNATAWAFIGAPVLFMPGERPRPLDLAEVWRRSFKPDLPRWDVELHFLFAGQERRVTCFGGVRATGQPSYAGGAGQEDIANLYGDTDHGLPEIPARAPLIIHYPARSVKGRGFGSRVGRANGS